MRDENGKPVGVLSHLVKTHVTDTSDGEALSALNKDFDHIKINDQFSNEDILSYTDPHVDTNKQNILADAVDVSSDKKRFAGHDPSGEEGKEFNLSSLPNTSNTGLMD